MELFKIKNDASGKIYRLVDDYDIVLETRRPELIEVKSETHYVLVNIDNADDIITSPISNTILHE